MRLMSLLFLLYRLPKKWASMEYHFPNLCTGGSVLIGLSQIRSRTSRRMIWVYDVLLMITSYRFGNGILCFDDQFFHVAN